VDFSQKMVVGVFIGEQRGSGGSIGGVEVLEVMQRGGSMVVSVREVQSPRGSVGLQVLTQPFHFMVLPRSEVPVKFEQP